MKGKLLVFGLAFLLPLACGKDESTEPNGSSIVGEWTFKSVTINNSQTHYFDKTIYVSFTDDRISFYAQGWTEGRGLPNDEARGAYTKSGDRLAITWDSDDACEAANDYLGQYGSISSQLFYSFDANYLLLEVVVEGDDLVYRCLKQ